MALLLTSGCWLEVQHRSRSPRRNCLPAHAIQVEIDGIVDVLDPEDDGPGEPERRIVAGVLVVERG